MEVGHIHSVEKQWFGIWKRVIQQAITSTSMMILGSVVNSLQSTFGQRPDFTGVGRTKSTPGVEVKDQLWTVGLLFYIFRYVICILNKQPYKSSLDHLDHLAS